MRSKQNLLSAILAAAILLLTSMPAFAATPEEIEAAINDGVAWLIANQNGDGSWGSWEKVAMTGLAVVKLEDRAREVPTNEYDDEIQAGLDYIFGQATVAPYGPGSGICFSAGGHETYNTGIAMMAIANDGDTSQTVGALGSAVDGMTYEQVLQGTVDFFDYSQNPDGGWRYLTGNQPSDQSNTGYAVLGLSYVESAGLNVDSVKGGLGNWINAIQDTSGGPDDGGSWYVPNSWSWVNELKTGNLIFEMSFLGIGEGDSRFDAAIAYIERHWRDPGIDPGWGYNGPPDYQAMYCLMKGLESSGIDYLDTDVSGDDEDWFNQDPPDSPAWDFASVIVATQEADGSWIDNNWGWGDKVLGTAWALLTLEKVTVVHKIDVALDVKPTSCPNPLNVGSKGMLPIAIVGTEDFDVTQVDLATVQLMLVDPARGAYEDVCTVYLPLSGKASQYDCTEEGPDGFMDLTLKFDCQVIAEALEVIELQRQIHETVRT
ncbi:MAG: hypothetical protein ACYS0H_29495, partial [Planctomycetota bacterium]